MCEFCSSAYHLSNAKWGTGEYVTPGGSVYWSFATSPGSGFGFSDYITAPDAQAAIRAAFQAWEDVADIDFIEVADGAATDIRLGWDSIDGPFGVVGEASSRGTRSNETLFSMTEAEIRFDIAEDWTTDRMPGQNEIGFYQVALHEIGHAIGLNHSQDPDTIMYFSDIGDLPGLMAGDIAGAQALYGAAAGYEPGGSGPSGPPQVGYAATRGDDMFQARSGDDIIDGLDGIDTLALTGARDNYTLTLQAGGNIVLTDRTGRDGSDTLIGIERLEFASHAQASGGAFEIDVFDGITGLDPADFARIVELYIAYFNRAPDALGLAFWGNAFADGLSLGAMAALFIDQDETRATYPASLGNADFAAAVYGNVLGRVPDAAGFDFWVDTLDSGAVGRDTFILAVLEGVRAAPPAGAPAEFIAQVAADADYLRVKTDIGAAFAVHRGMSDVDDAAQAMALFDGSAASVTDALAAIDAHYAEARSAEGGDFLMPLVGVLEDPFGGV